jgi:hypothetical protein
MLCVGVKLGLLRNFLLHPISSANSYHLGELEGHLG